MRRFTGQTIRAFVPDERRAYQSAQVYPSVFTERQCDRIIEQAAGLATEAGHVGTADDEAHHDQGIRRSRIAWIPVEEPFIWVCDKLTDVARRANRVYDFDLIGFTEDLQFTEYEGAGAHYTWHQDGLDGELAGRKLSLVAQLSDPDDYDGGNLELFAMDGDDDETTADWRATARRRGSVVVFPSFEYHRVTPLVSGTRRSLVTWVGGPAFR